MNEVLYTTDIEWFNERVNNGSLKNKKVLFAFGDSWTNNNYLQNIGEYPHSGWSYRLAKQIGYDAVVNISWNGGSNTEIYEKCLTMMCGDEDFQFDKCGVKDLGFSEFKVIVGWSSQYRDFGPIHKIFRPYTVTNIPEHVSNTLDAGRDKSILYYKFIEKLFKKEYYQYTTQIYSIFLQHYFKSHNIDSLMFMAFNPLVEESLRGTEWDLREYIDESRFYGLYDSISNMGQLLNQKGGYDIGDTFVLDQPYYYSTGVMNFFSKFFNKGTKFNEYLSSNKESRLNNIYLMDDGHPNSIGCEVIANELYSKLNSI